MARVLTSSSDQGARTPEPVRELARAMFFPALEARGGEMFDPCPVPERRPPGFDGLRAPWRAANFVNPPWRQAEAWLRKGAREAEERGRASVFLLAARTHARYFARLVFPSAARIVLMQNRVAFEGYPRGSAAPVALYAFGPVAPPAPLPPPGWRAAELPARLLALGNGGVRAPPFEQGVLPRLRTLYGPFDAELLGSRAPPAPGGLGRRSLVVVMGATAAHAAALLAHHRAQPGATTLALFVSSALASLYSCRGLVPAASELLLLCPALRFGGEESGPSASGSVGYLLGPAPRGNALARLDTALPARPVTLLSRTENRGGCRATVAGAAGSGAALTAPRGRGARRRGRS